MASATKLVNYAANGSVFYPGQQFSSINLQTDPNTGNNKIMMDVPYTAYGSPVFNIEVPVAMA